MAGKLLKKIGLMLYVVKYGTVALFRLLNDVITKGHGKVFNKTKRERPACLQDERFGIHGFLHIENIKIHYVATGPEDKPLMLFVHGFPEFWFTWRHQLIEFSKDYRCVAIDMRGYGESDKPTGMAKYQMIHLVKDIQQVIDALGYKSCTLVSHDWGARVAWYFAKQFPDYVDKLVALSYPPPAVFTKAFRTVKKQAEMSWYMFLFQLPRLPELMMSLEDYKLFDAFGGEKTFLMGSAMVNPTPTEEIEAYKYMYSQPGALSPPMNYFRAVIQMPAEEIDMDYEMPVLLLWGMQDIAMCDSNPAFTEKMAPKIVVKRIENAGHFVHHDVPVEANKIIRDWLAST